MTGGTTSWNLGGFPSHQVSRWRRGSGSFLRQKNLGWGRRTVVQSETAVPTSTVPAVLTAPDGAQMPLHPPGGLYKSCFDLFGLEWEVSGDREKLCGSQVLQKGASFPWVLVYTHKPELRQCCSHHCEVMLIHEGLRLLLSLFRGAWLTELVIRQKTSAKYAGLAP